MRSRANPADKRVVLGRQRADLGIELDLLLFQRLHAGGGLDQLFAQSLRLCLQTIALRLGRIDGRLGS